MSQADVLVVEDDAEINRLVGAYVQISGVVTAGARRKFGDAGI